MSDPQSNCCRHVFARGRVQGVAYRWSAAAHARQLNLSGWVRNLTDGRVEAWLEGPSADVEAMVQWMGHGPPAAQVDELTVLDAEPMGEQDFEIRATSQP